MGTASCLCFYFQSKLHNVYAWLMPKGFGYVIQTMEHTFSICSLSTETTNPQWNFNVSSDPIDFSMRVYWKENACTQGYCKGTDLKCCRSSRNRAWRAITLGTLSTWIIRIISILTFDSRHEKSNKLMRSRWHFPEDLSWTLITPGSFSHLLECCWS